MVYGSSYGPKYIQFKGLDLKTTKLWVNYQQPQCIFIQGLMVSIRLHLGSLTG